MQSSPRVCILALRVKQKEGNCLIFEGSPLPVHFHIWHFAGSLLELMGKYILVNILETSGRVEAVFLKKEDLKKSLKTPAKNNYLAFQALRLPSLAQMEINKEMFNPNTYISYKLALEEGEEGLNYFANLPPETLERIHFFLLSELTQDELTPIDLELLRLLALREVSIKDLSEKEISSFPLPIFQDLLKIIRAKNSLIEFLNEKELKLDIPRHTHRQEIHAFVKNELQAHILKENLLYEEEKQHLALLSQQEASPLIPSQFSSKEYSSLNQHWKDFFALIPVESATRMQKALKEKKVSAISLLKAPEKELLFLLTAYSPDICMMTPKELHKFPPHIKDLFENCTILQKLYYPQTEKEREEGLLFFNYVGPFSYRLQESVFEKINLKSESVYKDLLETVSQELHKGVIALFIDGKTVQRRLPLYYYEKEAVAQILSYLQSNPINMSKEGALRQLHCMHQEIFYHQLYYIENKFIPHTREEISWLSKANCIRTAPQSLHFYFYHPRKESEFRAHFIAEAYYLTSYGKEHPFHIKASSFIDVETGKGWMNLHVGRGLPHPHIQEPKRTFFDLSHNPPLSSMPSSPLKG